MYVTCMTCNVYHTCCLTCVTCMSELNQTYLCWGSLVVKDIFAVKVSMNILLLPTCTPKATHMSWVCAHTSQLYVRGQGSCISYFGIFCLYEAREKVLTWMARLCTSEGVRIRGNNNTRDILLPQKKIVRTEKLNKSLPLGNTLKIGLCA